MSEEQTPTTTTTTSSTPPQPVEENVGAGYSSPQELVARREFDKEMRWMKDRIGDTNFIMGVIIIVLAVGFITLLITVYGIVIQNSQFQSNTVQDLRNENQKLKEEKTNNQIRDLKIEIELMKENQASISSKK